MHYSLPSVSVWGRVLPPDINKSELGFTIEEGKVRFGLLRSKGWGATCQDIVQERRDGGSYQIHRNMCACEVRLNP